MEAPAGFVEVVEGGTRLLVPAGHTVHGPAARAKAAGTFYNRAMALGRDLSVLYMMARHRGSDVLAADVLAGTGARSVRWAVEAGLRSVTINDRSPEAAATIRRNLDRNGASAEVTELDARVLLAQRSFQHLELDPYGSPAPFLAAAFANLGRHGGVSFTATDAAALCGATPAPCRRRYGAEPTRTEELCHEAAVRILVAHAIREAAKHDQAAVPVLAYSREHYFRCYMETRRLAQRADELLLRIQWLVECDACLERGFAAEKPRTCSACGGRVKCSGPMWSGPLADAEVVAGMDAARRGATLARPRAAERDLAVWRAETAAGGLPFDTHRIAEREGIAEQGPVEAVLQALRDAGFPASRCHHDGMLLRTPAPAKDVVAAVRAAALRIGDGAGVPGSGHLAKP